MLTFFSIFKAPFLTFIQELTTKRGISLDDIIPSKPTDFHSEVACYSLPYGGLGFASHVLTYYTLVCLWFGKSPLWPFRGVSFSKLDLWLGSISIVITTGMTILTMIRCKSSWQLLTIAVWKMSMSLLNGITAINVAAIVMKSTKKHGDYWKQRKEMKEKEKEERKNKRNGKGSNSSLPKLNTEDGSPDGSSIGDGEEAKELKRPKTAMAAFWILLCKPMPLPLPTKKKY